MSRGRWGGKEKKDIRSKIIKITHDHCQQTSPTLIPPTMNGASWRTGKQAHQTRKRGESNYKTEENLIREDHEKLLNEKIQKQQIITL